MMDQNFISAFWCIYILLVITLPTIYQRKITRKCPMLRFDLVYWMKVLTSISCLTFYISTYLWFSYGIQVIVCLYDLICNMAKKHIPELSLYLTTLQSTYVWIYSVTYIGVLKSSVNSFCHIILLSVFHRRARKIKFYNAHKSKDVVQSIKSPKCLCVIFETN